MEDVLKDFIEYIGEKDKPIFTQIADIAINLGYKPKRAKTQDINYVFMNNKTKKHLLKFSIENDKPVVKLKFYATKEYSEIFTASIKQVIEEFDYRYTGCYQCGKCQGAPEGYVYTYPDGRSFFRCGSELIALSHVEIEMIPEISSLMKMQHEHFLSNLQVNMKKEK